MVQLRKRCPRYKTHFLVAICLQFFIFLMIEIAYSIEIRDFISTNILADGEIETRVFYKGVAAKDTTVVRKRLENLISFRQLSDGKHLIELIYNGAGAIIDCEFGHQRDRVKTFLNNFKGDLNKLLIVNDSFNITIESLNNKRLPKEFHWLNYTRLRKQCHLRHVEMKKEASFIRDNFQRPRRDISDLFRVPGTKWCGKGYSADKYTRLGTFSKTDRCCRKHDLSCPFWIAGFETKYGLFNWRLNTLMHCNCDERFRACLKTVGTSDASLVGKLFFNIVQTSCFVLKPKKKCVRSSWWGHCERYKVVKQAIVKNNRPF